MSGHAAVPAVANVTLRAWGSSTNLNAYRHQAVDLRLGIMPGGWAAI